MTLYRLLLAGAFLSVLSGGATAQVGSERCPGYVSAPAKLGTVLEAFCIPAPTAFDLEIPIQYGAYNGPNEFVLSLQRVPSSNSLEPQPLRIMRYDKPARTWATAELTNFRTEILPGVDGSCLGTVGGIEKVGPLFYVSIELSPSAVCQLVVSDDLKLKAVLSGWPVASFSSGAVVLQGSMRHFAPTHPLRLSLFDPRSATPTSIYPPQSDLPRAAYIKRLRTGVSPTDRCRGENCESGPEQFDSELGFSCESSGRCRPTIAVSDKTGSLAFIVKFSPTGFISSETLKSSKEWTQQIVYFYRLFPGPIVHREFTIADVQARFGTISLDKLLTPEMLTRIFAN